MRWRTKCGVGCCRGYSRARMKTRAAAPLAWVLLGLSPGTLPALDVVSYSPERHDRFSAGYSENPVAAVESNQSASFIGLQYDWSGVLWLASDRQRSGALLSRRHILLAEHFRPPNGSFWQFHSPATGLGSVLMSEQTVLSGSDIAVGRFARAVPAEAALAVYPVLEIRASAFNSSGVAQIDLPLLHYGWFARVGRSRLSQRLASATFSGGQTRQFLFVDPATGGVADWAQPVLFDSGSPSFLLHQGVLTLAGSHFAVLLDGGGYNSYLAWPGAVDFINGVMAPDGFSLAFLAIPSSTWTGGSSQFSQPNRWSPTGVPNASSVALFSDEFSSSFSITVSAASLRGAVFRTTGANGFTLSGNGPLALGYVGLRTEAGGGGPAARQRLEVPLDLAADQHWTSAGGELEVTGLVRNQGRLLTLAGSGRVTLRGGLSGTGDLAVLGPGDAVLASALAGPGRIWLHGGRLVLEDPGALSAVPLVMGQGGALAVLGGTNAAGVLRLEDDLRLSFGQAAEAILRFAASAGVDWPEGMVRIDGFDPRHHRLQVGESWGGLSFGQRQRVWFGEHPAWQDGDGFLTPSTPWQKWLVAQFAEAAGDPAVQAEVWAPAADPGGSGWSNLERYALAESATPGLPTAPQQTIADGGRLQMEIWRNPDATDLSMVVEVSPDLSAWEGGAEAVETLVDVPDRLLVRDRTPLAPGQPRFMRVRMELDPEFQPASP